MVLLWVVLAAAPVQAVDGGLDFARVQERISWHSPEINACLSGSPKRASVRYRFSVRSDGRVEQLAFLSAQKVEPPRVTCVGGALEKWRFAAGDAGTVVEWEFAVSTHDAGVPAEAEELPPGDMAPRWVDDVAACYDALSLNEKLEGLASLEVIALPSGGVVQASTLHAAPVLAETTLPACVQEKSLGWSFPPSSRVRRVRLHFVFATSARRAKSFFVPSSPAREIIAHSESLARAKEGGLDKDVIMAVIRKWNDPVRYCYETVLQTNPSLAGKVSIAWTIGPDGSVIESHSTDFTTLPSQRVVDCVLNVVDHGQFPRPIGGGNVNVTFPWVFRPAGEDE